MNIFVWLYIWFFLERFEWSTDGAYAPMEGVRETRTFLYQREFDFLLGSLRRQLPDNVSISFLSDRKAVIKESEEVIATITVFPKTDGKRHNTFVLVDLSPAYVGLKAWFELAFVGFKLRFRKPMRFPVRV